MAEPQLSVRSARAREIALRLARREQRSVASVVEDALQIYEARQDEKENQTNPDEQSEREPFDRFWTRLRETAATDVDLEAVIRENRKPHNGIDL